MRLNPEILCATQKYWGCISGSNSSLIEPRFGPRTCSYNSFWVLGPNFWVKPRFGPGTCLYNTFWVLGPNFWVKPRNLDPEPRYLNPEIVHTMRPRRVGRFCHLCVCSHLAKIFQPSLSPSNGN